MRWCVIVLAAACTLGCGPKAQLRDDPFRPASGRGRSSFARGDSAQRGRGEAADRSSEVFPPPRSKPATEDPFLSANTAQPPPAAAPAIRTDPSPAAAPAVGAKVTQPAAATEPDIRRRLERLGAKNQLLETDAQTGEILFRCAVDNPADPNVLRVFEARDKDVFRAMSEVASAIEAWQAQQKTK